MNNLTVTEYKNLRVLSTQQIAAVYETDTKIISNNFNRNKERYQEGKHFILLESDELRQFRANHQNDVSLNANKIYLWTEKGAFLHAKSLNTDVAWEIYDHLVDTYFASKARIAPPDLSPQLQLLINMELKQQAQDQKLNELEDKSRQHTEVLQTVKDTLFESCILNSLAS